MPNDTRGLEPPMATSGDALAKASATPVRRFVAPGPEAPMHTPGFRITRPQASADSAAACS